MHTFEVWAPRVRTLAVWIDGKSHPLARGEHGWWRGEVIDAEPDTDYRFSIDDRHPIPDPKSAWQPYGVHGASRIVDHSAFPWTDQSWQPRPLSSAIVYELHVGTFTPSGTFAGVIDRLDHLTDLGITHIELMPVNEFSGDWGWGYDGADLYAPHHVYGTPDDLKALINACHERGLAVLHDVVYNHFGPTGNYLNEFGPYFTQAYRTPWGAAVNLDHAGSFEVRRFLIDNALMWLRDYHFDGLRLDAVHAFHDSSAIHFLEQLSTEVDALASQIGRHLALIAESDLNNPRVVTSREAGGFGIDAQWSDDFHHALHAVLTGESTGYYEDFGSLAQLAKALKHAYVYDGIYSSYRDRVHGRPIIGLSGRHFVVSAQNHDQIGNRAEGDRLSHIAGHERQRIAAALVLLSPFVPMLFQGEEFGASSPFQYFTHHSDPELARAVSEGRRREFSAFGWPLESIPDPQDVATFERSKLRWEEVSEQPHAALLDWYKKLITLRRSTPALTDGRMDSVKVNFSEESKWLVFRRGAIQVVCNFAPYRQPIPIKGMPQEVIGSESNWELRPGHLELPHDSVAILRRDTSTRLDHNFRQHASRRAAGGL